MTQQIGYLLSKDQAVQSDIESGTTNKFANAAAIRAAMPYTKSFVSTEQTITNTSATTIAHGLTGIPYETIAVLRCKTTELGYAVGDEISVGASAGVSNISVAQNATNIILIIGNATPVVYNRTTFASTAITATNWRVVLKARG